MAVLLKVLGQAAPTANVLTQLYSVPATRSAVTSTLTVCNRSASSPLKYRVEVAPNGAATANQHAICRDVYLAPSGTATITIGMTLDAGCILRVQADSANASFNLFGQEMTA